MPSPNPSVKQRLRAILAEERPAAITEDVWSGLWSRLAPVSESYLRDLLRATGLPFAQPYCGIRQHTFEELEQSLREILEVYTAATAAGNRKLARYCRKQVIAAKDRARFQARIGRAAAGKAENPSTNTDPGNGAGMAEAPSPEAAPATARGNAEPPRPDVALATADGKAETSRPRAAPAAAAEAAETPNPPAAPARPADKLEMAEWMLVWLENPPVFPAWVEARKKYRNDEGGAV